MNEESVINYIIINLDMFSRLHPNLFVHLDRNNHFIVTSKTMANIIGAQTIANMYKLHDTKKLIKDLNVFFTLIIDVLTIEIVENNLNSLQIIKIICREFKLAFNGPPDINNAGLYGLIETYKNNELILQLENSIIFIKESIDNILSKTTKLECPEEHFIDEDWERAMNIVPYLQREHVNTYKYYINYSSVLTLNIFNGYDWSTLKRQLSE